MTDDLVARLRHEQELCAIMGDAKAGALVSEAADRLEAAEARVRELSAQLAKTQEQRRQWQEASVRDRAAIAEAYEWCAKVADKVEIDAESELSGLFYSERYGMSCRRDAATEIAVTIRKLAQEVKHEAE